MFRRITRIHFHGAEGPAVKPTPKKMSGVDKAATLLDHQFNAVIFIVLAVFVVLSILIGLDRQYSTIPVCNERVILKDWVANAMATAFGCAVLTCTLQIVRVTSLLFFEIKNSQYATDQG